MIAIFLVVAYSICALTVNWYGSEYLLGHFSVQFSHQQALVVAAVATFCFNGSAGDTKISGDTFHFSFPLPILLLPSTVVWIVTGVF